MRCTVTVFTVDENGVDTINVGGHHGARGFRMPLGSKAKRVFRPDLGDRRVTLGGSVLVVRVKVGHLGKNQRRRRKLAVFLKRCRLGR